MKTRIQLLFAMTALCVLATGCQKKSPADSTSSTGGTETPVTRDDGFGTTAPAPANTDTRDGVTDDEATQLERQLQPVYFAFDRADLTQESRDILTSNARALREKPGFDVVIEGHCDERGTNEYNLALGDRRARAARDFLVTSGIPASRFSIVSYGEERPFAFGHEEASWSQNRRAHFRVSRR